MKAYRFTLILIGLGALVALGSPSLIVGLAFSLIGIPLALALMAAPTLALYLIPTHFIWSLVRRLPVAAGLTAGFGGWLVSLILTVGLSAGLSLQSRFVAWRELQALTAGDVAMAERPRLGGTIGLLRDGPADVCDDLCLRLLLGGTAARVLTAAADDAAGPGLLTSAHAWTLERRTNCPGIHADTGNRRLTNIAGEDSDPAAVQPLEALRGRLVKGECLVEAPDYLGESDAVIAVVRIGNASQWGHGWRPTRETVTADRESLFIRADAGFQEAYRRTKAVVFPQTALLAITFEGGLESQRSALMRRRVAEGMQGFLPDDGPDPVHFLVDQLGLSLTVRDASRPARIRDQIERTLALPGPFPAPQRRVVYEWLYQAGLRGLQTKAEQDLFLRLAADDRVELAVGDWQAIPDPEAAPQAFFVALASALFTRMLDETPDKRDWSSRVASMASVIAKLPDEALAGHEEDLARLAKDRTLRVYAAPALTRLSSFGDGGTATLLWLVEDARREVSTVSGYGPESAYRAGLSGLCLAGPESAAARTGAVALVERGVISVGQGLDRELAISMLAQLGLSQQDIVDLARRSGQSLQAPQLGAGLNQARSASPCGQ